MQIEDNDEDDDTTEDSHTSVIKQRTIALNNQPPLQKKLSPKQSEKTDSILDNS